MNEPMNEDTKMIEDLMWQLNALAMKGTIQETGPREIVLKYHWRPGMWAVRCQGGDVVDQIKATCALRALSNRSSEVCYLIEHDVGPGG